MPFKTEFEKQAQRCTLYRRASPPGLHRDLRPSHRHTLDQALTQGFLGNTLQPK